MQMDIFVELALVV